MKILASFEAQWWCFFKRLILAECLAWGKKLRYTTELIVELGWFFTPINRTLATINGQMLEEGEVRLISSDTPADTFMFCENQMYSRAYGICTNTPCYSLIFKMSWQVKNFSQAGKCKPLPCHRWAKFCFDNQRV